MQLDLMLCDHAQVSGDKLFVSGAGINRMRVPAESVAPYVINFALAGVVTIAPAEARKDHVVAFRVVTVDGRVPSLAGSPDGEANVGGELVLVAGDTEALDDQLVAVAFSFQGVPLMELGHYVVVADVNGMEVRRINFVVEAV